MSYLTCLQEQVSRERRAGVEAGQVLTTFKDEGEPAIFGFLNEADNVQRMVAASAISQEILNDRT